MGKIDFVITWVDGNDVKWLAEREKYDENKCAGNNAAHYRDYGTLKYWFRAVEKYAPWVNKIHFVTCGQKPEWLNEKHPKLQLVDHSDYMPTEYLPTFSVNPIELNFHRIDGLAEQFVYFNDDTFLMRATTEEDFFKNGLPCDSMEFSALIPSVKNEAITYILFNDLLLINSNFNKKQFLKNNWRKCFNFKYGKAFIKNLYYAPIGKFTGFTNLHLPNSFLKSTFEEVWNKEGEYLHNVCKNRFRTNMDVNQYLMQYWQLVTGNFSPRFAKIGACYTLGIDNEIIEQQFKQKKLKMMCINDNPNLPNLDNEFEWLNGLFERELSVKSSFEK